jgi:hypothetical protein
MRAFSGRIDTATARGGESKQIRVDLVLKTILNGSFSGFFTAPEMAQFYDEDTFSSDTHDGVLTRPLRLFGLWGYRTNK